MLSRSYLLRGLVLDLPDRAVVPPNLTRLSSAKVLLAQFCFDRPRTSDGFKVVIHDAAQLDRLIREEENYVKGLVVALRRDGAWPFLVVRAAQQAPLIVSHS